MDQRLCRRNELQIPALRTSVQQGLPIEYGNDCDKAGRPVALGKSPHVEGA
jgi:hypothetical protein